MVCWAVLPTHPRRLRQQALQLAARESELDKLRDQLQAEVNAAAQKAAAQQAELAGERGLLAKQSAALDQERESFRAWVAERKEELGRSAKVGTWKGTEECVCLFWWAREEGGGCQDDWWCCYL